MKNAVKCLKYIDLKFHRQRFVKIPKQFTGTNMPHIMTDKVMWFDK